MGRDRRVSFDHNKSGRMLTASTAFVSLPSFPSYSQSSLAGGFCVVCRAAYTPHPQHCHSSPMCCLASLRGRS